MTTAKVGLCCCIGSESFGYAVFFFLTVRILWSACCLKIFMVVLRTFSFGSSLFLTLSNMFFLQQHIYRNLVMDEGRALVDARCYQAGIFHILPCYCGSEVEGEQAFQFQLECCGQRFTNQTWISQDIPGPQYLMTLAKNRQRWILISGSFLNSSPVIVSSKASLLVVSPLLPRAPNKSLSIYLSKRSYLLIAMKTDKLQEVKYSNPTYNSLNLVRLSTTILIFIWLLFGGIARLEWDK